MFHSIFVPLFQKALLLIHYTIILSFFWLFSDQERVLASTVCSNIAVAANAFARHAVETWMRTVLVGCAAEDHRRLPFLPCVPQFHPLFE